jgi:hypothetical protein
VSFGVVAITVTETTTKLRKLLFTYVPDNVKPLTKARSAAHRKELADYVIVCDTSSP